MRSHRFSKGSFLGFCPYVLRRLEWLRQNDNPVGKLLGQKMVDKIRSLFPCLRIVLVKNIVIPMFVVLH
jgi:hypothetical protein